MDMKPEPILAELNRLRKDAQGDLADIEWLALHHAFVFISYKMSEFQKYVAEADLRGEFKDFKESRDR